MWPSHRKSDESRLPRSHFDRRANNAVFRALIFAAAIVGLSTDFAHADETGVSLWVPGFFGSLAATPQTPGFAFANIFYAPSVSAGGSVVFARQVTRGNITGNFNGNLSARLDGCADLYLGIPSYTFSNPVLGGQAMVAFGVPYGGSFAGVSATLNGVAGPKDFTISRGANGNVEGFGDLLPMFSLRWNFGVNNYMTYVTGNIPVGVYNPDNLVNLGIGHVATDAGVGYLFRSADGQ
jgi:hypothetical protein